MCEDCEKIGQVFWAVFRLSTSIYSRSYIYRIMPDVARSEVGHGGGAVAGAVFLRHLTPAGSGSGSHAGLTHFSDAGPIMLEFRNINNSTQVDAQPVRHLKPNDKDCISNPAGVEDLRFATMEKPTSPAEHLRLGWIGEPLPLAWAESRGW